MFRKLTILVLCLVTGIMVTTASASVCSVQSGAIFRSGPGENYSQIDSTRLSTASPLAQVVLRARVQGESLEWIFVAVIDQGIGLIHGWVWVEKLTDCHYALQLAPNYQVQEDNSLLLLLELRQPTGTTNLMDYLGPVTLDYMWGNPSSMVINTTANSNAVLIDYDGYTVLGTCLQFTERVYGEMLIPQHRLVISPVDTRFGDNSAFTVTAVRGGDEECPEIEFYSDVPLPSAYALSFHSVYQGEWGLTLSDVFGFGGQKFYVLPATGSVVLMEETAVILMPYAQDLFTVHVGEVQIDCDQSQFLEQITSEYADFFYDAETQIFFITQPQTSTLYTEQVVLVGECFAIDMTLGRVNQIIVHN